MRKILLSFFIVLHATVFLAHSQDKRADGRNLADFVGKWVQRDQSRASSLPETFLILAEDKRLTIITNRLRGQPAITVVELFVDKRGERNSVVRADGKKVETKSSTSWEGGAVVRRYVQTPRQTTDPKMFVSEHYRLSKDRKELTLTYLFCPEGIWPTNPGQEQRMCFDDKRTFVRRS
jgi:hypothetical protein